MNRGSVCAAQFQLWSLGILSAKKLSSLFSSYASPVTKYFSKTLGCVYKPILKVCLFTIQIFHESLCEQLEQRPERLLFWPSKFGCSALKSIWTMHSYLILCIIFCCLSYILREKSKRIDKHANKRRQICYYLSLWQFTLNKIGISIPGLWLYLLALRLLNADANNLYAFMHADRYATTL